MRMKEMKMGGVNFTHVGGLEEHIKCLKEVVMFPLIYRDVYERFHIKPPRGVLFHGPPGTGKTLVAGALANECCQGDRQVSFYSRKGADCLNKWVGESEKKLRALFEKAQQTRPSIIFFDEIDGLAPVRSSRQDQVHSSVVSTLLALMDGLDTKSEIIVIGATNRIDAIDPALRRPGRFDRELYFPLPGLKARQDILNVHVKAWRDKPNEYFINKLASSTVGYCGSDLQALCGEAVMCGLRRQYPDIYNTEHMVKVNAKTLKVETTDFLRAKVNIIPAAHRTLVPQVKRLPYAVRPLLQNMLKNVIGRLQVYSPLQFLHPNSSCKYLRGLTHCPRLLLTGSPLQGHTSHLAPAILHYLEHLPVHLLDVTTLHDSSTHSTEEACIQKVREARHNLPGILYLPDITTWWDLVGEQTRVVFLTLVGNIDSSIPLFILATANCSQSDLASPLQEMFSDSYGQVMAMVNPTKLEREEFFRPVFFIIPLLHQPNTAKENNVLGVKEVFVESSEANISTSGPVQLPNLQVDCSGASISQCRHLSRGQTFVPHRSIEHIGKAVVNETSMSVLRSGKKRRTILDNGPVLKRQCVGSSSHESSKLAVQLETGTNGNVKVKQEIKDYTCEVVLSDLDLNELLPSCSTKQSGCDTGVNISHDHLSELFHLTVTLTENCPFQLLERLYGSLLVCITHYRNQLDRQQLTQDLETRIFDFDKNILQKFKNNDCPDIIK